MRVLIFCLISFAASASPFHTPIIDGIISGDGVDWDPVDLVVDDIYDDNPIRLSNVRRLWCTWDEDSLYVAVTYQDFATDQALSIYLDLDRGIGPNDASVLGNNAGNYLMPAGHRIELVLGRNFLDAIEGPPPGTYLVTSNGGTMALLEDQINAAQSVNLGTGAEQGDKGRFPIWSNAEIALPWLAIYPTLGGKVPVNAVIKMVGLVGNAHPDSSGWDSAPDNVGGPGTVLLENLSPSVIDANGDGQPDPADATISGTVTLPGDPGTGSVTVQAVLIDFAGRDPGAPLSVVTTPDGIRTWTLPRLPAGRYTISTRAVGYLSDEFIIDVAQSQSVVGQDQTLENATAISGTISFASGPGAPGSVELRDPAGLVLDSLELTAMGGPFSFFVEQGGEYVVYVTSDTYLDAEWPVAVTLGVDVTNIDISMIRQTEISGSITFAEGPGQPGNLLFANDDGEILDSVGFSSIGGSFQFFTPVGGNFTLSTATFNPIYAPLDSTIAVTAGVDITDLVLNLYLVSVTGINDSVEKIRPVLFAAQPNPFNPQTTIAFELPRESSARLMVFDVSGRLVNVLIDNEVAAEGRNEVVWRGRDMGGRIVSAGVYFYRLEAGDYSATKRVVLVK